MAPRVEVAEARSLVSAWLHTRARSADSVSASAAVDPVLKRFGGEVGSPGERAARALEAVESAWRIFSGSTPRDRRTWARDEIRDLSLFDTQIGQLTRAAYNEVIRDKGGQGIPDSRRYRLPLPRSLTGSERRRLADWLRQIRRHARDEPTTGASRLSFGRAPAEFEPADGVLVAWPHSNLSRFFYELIREIADDGKVFLAVEPRYQERARGYLSDFGVAMENVEMVPAPLDSYWMRDYGPCFVFSPEGDRVIVDLIYNRPRPDDDAFPRVMARKLGLPIQSPDLILPPGNLIISNNVAIMTDVVFDKYQGGDPDMTVEELEAAMKASFGVDRVILLKRMNRDGTGHVDMFCKLLDDRKIIVGEYARPEDGARGNYEILNENAAKLASSVNGNGEPFEVIRIPMPPYTGTSYTYTNSTIYNDKVLVPIYGHDLDDEALAVYREALPTHEVVGIRSNEIIKQNGAIHCVTKLVMSDRSRESSDAHEKGNG